MKCLMDPDKKRWPLFLRRLRRIWLTARDGLWPYEPLTSNSVSPPPSRPWGLLLVSRPQAGTRADAAAGFYLGSFFTAYLIHQTCRCFCFDQSSWNRQRISWKSFNNTMALLIDLWMEIFVRPLHHTYLTATHCEMWMMPFYNILHTSHLKSKMQSQIVIAAADTCAPFADNWNDKQTHTDVVYFFFYDSKTNCAAPTFSSKLNRRKQVEYIRLCVHCIRSLICKLGSKLAEVFTGQRLNGIRREEELIRKLSQLTVCRKGKHTPGRT